MVYRLLTRSFHGEGQVESPVDHDVDAGIAHHSIALPVGPHLQPDDAEYVADTVTKVVKELL